MRVAVNAEQLLYRSPGGIGRYTAQLLTLMPARHPDLEVVPFTARHPRAAVGRVLAEAGVAAGTADRTAVLAWPRPVLYEGWVRGGWPPLRLAPRPDVVHAPSVAVPPPSGCPLVVTVHDAAPELFPEAFPRRGRAFHRQGLAAAARRADVVVAVSGAAAEEIVSWSAIPADRVRVVHNGIDPPAPDPVADARILAARGLSGRRYVLWVGSLEPRKGVGTLVAAVAGLRRQGAHTDTALVLAGYDGWLVSGLVDAADRRELGDSLVELGRLAEPELWAVYRGATVFAFPSRHEGFGLPVVEAMSQGVPVVASDIAALREVAGEAAALVPADDARAWAGTLDGLLSDDASRSRLAAAGRRRAAMFTAARMVDATRGVYQQIGS